MKRVLLRALKKMLPEDWALDVVSELDEAHRRRRSDRGELRADAWLLAQTLAFGTRFTVERLREWADPGRWRESVHSLAGETRITLRSLRKAPLFVGTVVLTLGIGIGATTAIFSVVQTVVLEPLPYPDSERLVVVDPNPWTPAEIALDLERNSEALDLLAGFYPRRYTVTGTDRPEELEGAVVTSDFFRLLGAEMALGRGFARGSASAREAVLSHGAWQRRYGGASDVLGRTLTLDGIPHVVVGVVEEGFRQLTPRTGEPEVWTPGPLDDLGAAVLPEGSPAWAIPVARVSDGGRERAQTELAAAAGRYREGRPDMSAGPRWDLRWTSLRSEMTADARTPLLVLQAAVGVLLLLACVNVANLLLVRLRSRRSEMAVRAAVGASRWRLLRQLLTESMVLAVLGGLAGLGLLAASLELLVALAPSDLPRIGELSVDSTVLLFVVAVSIGTGLLFGVVPGFLSTRTPSHHVLKEGGRTSTGSRRSHRLSQGLVVAEITLTLVLVVGAGLLARSFASLAARDPGFRTEDVMAVRMSAPENRYGSVPELRRYQERLLERIRGLPQVESVGLANNTPNRRGSAIRSYVVEGSEVEREAQYGVVSPGYFRALDIPLLRGRAFEEGDGADAPKVAIVDEEMAQEAWPGRDPLGARFRLTDTEEWVTVVGIAASTRGGGLGRPPEPGFYIPYRQRPDTPVELAVGKDMVLLVHGRESGEGLAEFLRLAIWDVDPAQPVPEITALQAVLAVTVRPERFRATLLSAFAFIALILAVAGVYGVVANLLAERTHEFGIRRALGATSKDVVGTVLGWGLRLTALGVLVGLVGVLGAGRILSSLLVGVGPADPATIAVGVITVVGVTMAACLIPARRATRIEAVMTARSE